MAPPSALFVPDRGHLVWMQFDPQAGHEQAGRRPALVLSPASYNRLTKLCVVCPITNQIKGYAFEVLIPAGLPVTGVVLVDHLRSVAFIDRKAEHIAKAPDKLVAEALAKLDTLLR
jgi:mRNA interferase MazF